jgi:hypothetical protein
MIFHLCIEQAIPESPAVDPWIGITCFLTVTGILGGLASGLVQKRYGTIPGSGKLGDLAIDAFVGLVAANSIHLAFAGVLNYSTPKDTKLVVSLISIGLVAGFSGPKVLQALARRLENTFLKDRIEKAEKRVASVEKDARGARDVAFKMVEGMMVNPLAPDRKTEPWVKDVIDVAAKAVLEEKEDRRSAGDWLMTAFKALQDGDYAEAVARSEQALRASPGPELTWKIYNILGLSHHFRQPEGWKKGDDLDWFSKARDNYDLALRHARTPDEKQLVKANQAFVYYDAEEYGKAAVLAQEIVQQPAGKPRRMVNQPVLDLARIVGAASLIESGDEPEAVKMLNQVRSLDDFDYLFKEKDIQPRTIAKLNEARGLEDRHAITIQRLYS